MAIEKSETAVTESAAERKRSHCRKYDREVEDLDHNWKDGVLFNALIHHADPTLVDMTAVRGNSDGRRNLEHAFAVAEQRLHIPRLLDLDDVDCTQPDKRSIMTYLVQFLRKTADRRPLNSHSGTKALS